MNRYIVFEIGQTITIICGLICLTLNEFGFANSCILLAILWHLQAESCRDKDG